MFLIDNSPSKEEYHNDIVKAFTGLSFVAKRIDPDGVELGFLSAPKELYQKRNISGLIQIVDRHPYSHMSGVPEANLGTFLEKAVHSKLRHWSRRRSLITQKILTLFMFTDGNWGEKRPDAAGVQEPIKNLMDTMSKREVART